MISTLPATQAYHDFATSDEAREIKDFLAGHGRHLLVLGCTEIGDATWYYGFGPSGYESRSLYAPAHYLARQGVPYTQHVHPLNADDFAALIAESERPAAPGALIANILAQYARMQDDEATKHAEHAQSVKRDALMLGFALVCAAIIVIAGGFH